MRDCGIGAASRLPVAAGGWCIGPRGMAVPMTARKPSKAKDGLGPCAACTRPAVVGLNGRDYCQRHFNVKCAQIEAEAKRLKEPKGKTIRAWAVVCRGGKVHRREH